MQFDQFPAVQVCVPLQVLFAVQVCLCPVVQLHGVQAFCWQVSFIPLQFVSQLLSVVVQFDHFFSEVHVCVPLQVLFAVQDLLLPSSVQEGPTTQLSS